jgi:hypothetical protein
MDTGVYYQAELFRRDYRGGDAIAERYLALVRSANYATTGGRQNCGTFGGSNSICHPSLGLPDGLLLEGRRMMKAFEMKILRALEIFSGGREMPARVAFNKVKQMGYRWNAKEENWQKLCR